MTYSLWISEESRKQELLGPRKRSAVCGACQIFLNPVINGGSGALVPLYRDNNVTHELQSAQAQGKVISRRAVLRLSLLTHRAFVSHSDVLPNTRHKSVSFRFIHRAAYYKIFFCFN